MLQALRLGCYQCIRHSQVLAADPYILPVRPRLTTTLWRCWTLFNVRYASSGSILVAVSMCPPLTSTRKSRQRSHRWAASAVMHTKHFIHEVSEPSPGHRKSSKKEGKLACPGHPHHTTHRFADSRSQKHRLRQAFELASPWPAQELQLLVHRSIQDIFASEAWFGR